MKSLFIDCQLGISGDMLLSSFLDLGLPKDLIEDEFNKLGLNKYFQLNVLESKSFGMRGLKIELEELGGSPFNRSWKDIKNFIDKTFVEDSLKKNILKVYEKLVFAESTVHGSVIDEVVFHEIGSLKTFINIVGVCFAFDYFNFQKVFATFPPAGSGLVNTSHGFLSVPVPTVLEIAKSNNIALSCGKNLPSEELTTPSGIALISNFVDSFEQPSVLEIINIGIGLGTRNIGQPNFLRVFELNHLKIDKTNKSIPNAFWQDLVCQEAWIDDSSPEDLAGLIYQLRRGGALEVISYPIQMKKGRQGISVKAIVTKELSSKLRSVWFMKGTTIGLRESHLGRWVLARRKGVCNSIFGNVKVKQVKRIDGLINIKPEHDEILRLSHQQDKSPEEIRNSLYDSLSNFVPDEDWSF